MVYTPLSLRYEWVGKDVKNVINLFQTVLLF